MRNTRILEIKIIMDEQERKNQEENQIQEQEASTHQNKALTIIPQPEEETIVIDAESVYANKRISVWFTLIILLSSVIIDVWTNGSSRTAEEVL